MRRTTINAARPGEPHVPVPSAHRSCFQIGTSRLEPVDQEPAGVERVGPVRRADGNHDRRLADGHPAQAVQDGDLGHLAVGPGRGDQAVQVLDGHLGVGVVVEGEQVPAVGGRLGPRRAEEDGDPAGGGVGDERDGGGGQ